MSAIPSLYIKWCAFRALVGERKTDVMDVFNDHSGSFRFSKLLYGDIRCTPEIAAKVVQVINDRLLDYKNAKRRADVPFRPLNSGDLEEPVYPFVKRMLDTAGAVDEGEFARVHAALLQEVAVQSRSSGPKLVVERYLMDRAFPSTLPSDSKLKHPVFRIGKNKGQLAVTGVTKAPLAAYVMLARDPAPFGRKLWDLSWGETIFWLPSPFVPKISGDRLLLMPDPEPVQPLPGHFFATAALVWDEDAIDKLDPRGTGQSPDVLDENETTQFLTNLRRLEEDKRKKWVGAVTVTSAEYMVEG